MANRVYSWDDPNDALGNSEEPPDATLDPEWVKNELIPLLETAYGQQEAGHWEERVHEAMRKVDSLTIWEAFDSTVERFRLLLVNKEILSRAEMEDFGWLRDKVDTCIAVFVRHALFNGPYELHSLGTAPSPVHPRAKITEENQDTYIFGGKLAIWRSSPPKQRKKDEGKRSRPHDDVQSDDGFDKRPRFFR